MSRVVSTPPSMFEVEVPDQRVEELFVPRRADIQSLARRQLDPRHHDVQIKPLRWAARLTGWTVESGEECELIFGQAGKRCRLER